MTAGINKKLTITLAVAALSFGTSLPSSAIAQQYYEEHGTGANPANEVQANMYESWRDGVIGSVEDPEDLRPGQIERLNNPDMQPTYTTTSYRDENGYGLTITQQNLPEDNSYLCPYFSVNGDCSWGEDRINNANHTGSQFPDGRQLSLGDPPLYYYNETGGNHSGSQFPNGRELSLGDPPLYYSNETGGNNFGGSSANTTANSSGPQFPDGRQFSLGDPPLYYSNTTGGGNSGGSYGNATTASTYGNNPVYNEFSRDQLSNSGFGNAVIGN